MSAPPDTRRPLRAWPLFQGGALLMLGLLAVVLPVISRFGWPQVMGAVLLSAGAIGLVSSLAMHRVPGLRWPLLSGLLAAAAGALVLSTLGGEKVLVQAFLAVILFVLADSLLFLGYGLTRRSTRSRGWGWMIVAGLGELGLGALMAATLFGLLVIRMPLLLPGATLAWNGLMLVLLGLAAGRGTRGALPAAAP